nr:hypothetical protein [Pandoravirus belohorizontensis]
MAGTWIKVTSTGPSGPRCVSLIQRAQSLAPQPRSTDGDVDDDDVVEARDDSGEHVAVLGGMATGNKQEPSPKEGLAEICESEEEKERIEEDDGDDEDEDVDTKEGEGDDERDKDDDDDECKRAHGRGLVGHDRVVGAGDGADASTGDDPINETRERGGDRAAEAGPRSVRCERAHEAMLLHTDRGERARRAP